MASIILTTLNARYIHSSLGLRYLNANMGDLLVKTTILEFIINQNPLDIVEKLLQHNPVIVGFGVYIWNVEQTTQVIALLKQIRPEVFVVIGGPEVSFEHDVQPIVKLTDYVITGMADLTFPKLCNQLIKQHRTPEKIIASTPVPLAELKMPYLYYTDEDIANRVIYVEASRGCPYKCEFCLSALDKTAWPLDFNLFMQQIHTLYERGARQFKFVDRTFNLKIDTSINILEFFLQRMDENLFVHFELVPDHIPDRLKHVIQRFPPASLQFEIGIQSFNPTVQTLISRKQNNDKAAANLAWLRQSTHAHLHADLIIGLPGEDINSFANGFDKLVALNPHEIQVGILKRLRGAPIIRHINNYEMKFNPFPPYNILSTNQIDFEAMQQLSRFARYWDLIANSGRFNYTKPIILGDSPFNRFMRLSKWLFMETGQTHKISKQPTIAVLFYGAEGN